MTMFSILLLGCTPTKTDTATQEVLDNGLVDNVDPETPFNNIQGSAPTTTYHVAPESTTVGAEWNYTHDPLDTQLDKGIRQFEIDVVLGSRTRSYRRSACSCDRRKEYL